MDDQFPLVKKIPNRIIKHNYISNITEIKNSILIIWLIQAMSQLKTKEYFALLLDLTMILII